MLRNILSNAVIITHDDNDSDDPFYVLYIRCNQDVETPDNYISPEMDWTAYGKEGESYPLCISQNFERLRDLQAILKYFHYCRNVFTPLIDTFENFNQSFPNCSIDEEDAMFQFEGEKFYVEHFYFSTMFNIREDSLILPIEESGPVLIRCLN